MSKAWLTCVALLACVGCAGPSVTTRPVYTEASWFVRLDSFADAQKASALLHDHPVDGPEAELNTILSRLQMQERVGLLDETPPPQPLFSPDEIKHIAPQLQAAFRMARPSEWVAFYLSRPAGATLEITSGAFFLKGGYLHIVIANPRDRISPGHDGAEEVRANPIRSLGGKGIRLRFDPPKYVLATQTNWMAGSTGPPASEMILDQRAFLADARPTAPVPVVSPIVPPPAASARLLPPTTPTPPTPKPQARDQANDPSDVALKDLVIGLQDEVQRLRQRLDDQADEIAQLRIRLAQPDTSKKNQLKKKPPR